MYVPIYRKWWFWVGVAVLCAGTAVLKWQMVMSPVDEENQIRSTVQQAYVSIMTKRGEEMVAKQKADTYGGATPEETLKLFVEALEKKDYELASKYFETNLQAKNLKELKLGDSGGANIFFIDAYRKGRVIPPSGVGSSGIYEIEVFPAGQSTAFGVRLIQNEYTKKWKIREL